MIHNHPKSSGVDTFALNACFLAYRLGNRQGVNGPTPQQHNTQRQERTTPRRRAYPGILKNRQLLPLTGTLGTPYPTRQTRQDGRGGRDRETPRREPERPAHSQPGEGKGHAYSIQLRHRDTGTRNFSQKKENPNLGPGLQQLGCFWIIRHRGTVHAAAELHAALVRQGFAHHQPLPRRTPCSTPPRQPRTVTRHAARPTHAAAPLPARATAR